MHPDTVSDSTKGKGPVHICTSVQSVHEETSVAARSSTWPQETSLMLLIPAIDLLNRLAEIVEPRIRKK